MIFFGFFRPTQKIAWDGPKWGREVFFPANPDLADILGDADFDFENFYVGDFFVDPEFWNLETWKFGIQKNPKNKNSQIQIRSAKNVGKVWISRKKNLPAPFGTIPGNLLRVPKKNTKKCIFPLAGQ